MKRTTHSGTQAVPSRLPEPIRPAQAAPESALAIDPKWWWHYRTLMALRDRLRQESQEHWSEAAVGIEPHQLHPADRATDETDHDLAMTLLAREETAMTEINDALTRIRNGSYGRCEVSGQPIPDERLRAVPWCRFTREVEERREARGGAS